MRQAFHRGAHPSRHGVGAAFILSALVGFGGNLHADTTFTFRNGVNGYSGAQDISINNQYAEYNGGNGIQWRGNPELGCYSITGDGAYEVRYLLKFGGLSIPAGSSVLSASLTMSFDAWFAGGNISGFYLKTNWNPASNNTGWLHKDGSTDWAAPGASGAGADVVAGKSFRLPALRAVGTQNITIPLDRDQIQAWIDNPAANQGILLANNVPGDVVHPLSTAAQANRRPMLTIVVAGAPDVRVRVDPPAITLQPGQKQQFTATVTGASNAGVTWSATGGAVTAAGLFTAGSAVGSFQVTAASLADATKSNSANVMVQAAPPVSVTVSPASATVQQGKIQQFTATVTGTSNTAVTWTAAGGTISTGGLFRAGSTAGSFQVTATSLADATKSGSANVTVPAAPPVSVTVSPAGATVQQGKTRQFTATVTGTSNTAVTWSATGGTISASGLYTAGSVAGSFGVTATSVADTLKSNTVTVAVTVPQPSLAVSPGSVGLLPSGTQQFTATGTGSNSVTWSATGGVISASGLYTAGSSAGSFTVTATNAQSQSASASVTVFEATNTVHPRIILDAPTLSTLRSRAQVGTQEWTKLRSVCDSFTGGGTVNFIGQNGYPDPPNVGEGYQGSGYFDALMPLGLCYQTLIASDSAAASKYAAKAVAILMAMADPAHQSVGGTMVWDRDNGYGIRNFGVAMGIAYDWFHDALTEAQKTRIQTALSHWIDGFEHDDADSFEYDHPQGNYFAGYYAAKCMAALAVQGDSVLGDIWWNDWYNHQHLQRVQPYYAANLAGGGWLEGFAQYGILSSRNQSLPALAVKTAKGIDIIHGDHPYSFPFDQAGYLMHFTWPSRDIIDDRGELYSTGDPGFWPGTGSVDIYRFYAGFLAMWGHPAAAMMLRYAEDAKAALDAIHAGGTSEWIDFLFWSPSAPSAPDYSSLPLSYLAPGIGEVGARSDWTKSATFLSFLSGPYINNPAAGHEAFDKGSPAIERNRTPLLVNPPAWLSHEPNGDPGWTYTYDDRFGNWDADHSVGNRTFYNTFQVRNLDASGGVRDNYGEWALGREDGVKTKVSRYEDGGSYVLATGQFLEDMYRPFRTVCTGRSPVTEWSRQIVYLRPSQVVIYDRTGVCDASLDQYLAFHFPGRPVEVASPGPGSHRFDVNNGAQFAGSMTTILPADVLPVTNDRLSDDSRIWNKVWRTELRAPGAATKNHVWLNVFDLAPSSSQIAAATAVNVTSGAAVGALLQSAAGNSVVVSGAAAVGTAIAGPLNYVVPAAQTRHVVTDLTPSAGYTILVNAAGGNHSVSLVPGGSTIASANGVISFQVNAGGQITQ